ncbi:M28 family metallopeptidase [Dactylosporangium sp. McL0621]|uniref:M28 family metallopeptidase n=1 Tax=Dactylosporangium sp. McL0621 TaxID=3415678 RepID=UPI003CF74062
MSTPTRPPASAAVAADRLHAALGRIAGGRMAATVAALAGDAFAGRRVGSAGGAAARTWLAQHLADNGAAVTLEPFTVPHVPEVYTTPTVHWSNGGGAEHRLMFGRQVAVHLASADEALIRRGALAVAGAGDPVGRWLAVPDGMTLSDAYAYAYGHAHGALGLLLGRGVDADGWQYTMLAGPNPGPLPILTLDTATHTAVLDAASAGTGWFAGNTPIRRLEVPAANVHGRWRRAAGDLDVLLTAHYDGVGDHPGLRQPAAADNGSGVAVVLEVGRVLAEVLPDTAGLAVALLDGEEAGALGSAHHAAQLRAAGATPLVINVDGAGNLHQAATVEAGGPADALLAALDQAGRHTGLPLTAGPIASDNRRYAAAGLAAIGIGAGMAGYHSPADTADRVETATLTAVARLVVAAGLLLAADPATVSS